MNITLCSIFSIAGTTLQQTVVIWERNTLPAHVNDRWFIMLAFVLWLIPSAGQLFKYLGTWGTLFAAAVALAGLTLGVKYLNELRPEQRRSLRTFTPAALAAVTVGLFAVFYPLSNAGVFGLGSDRDEALNVAIDNLLHGLYPYYASTRFGNPPTPAPGALLLAIPFYLLGSSALQNLFWVPFFLFYCRRFFDDALIGSIYFLVFVLACPGALQDFVTGGDYLVNAIYVAVATDLAARIQEQRASRAIRWAVYGFLAVAISSRFIYLIVALVLAAFVWQRRGLQAAIEFVAIIAVFVVAINAPFYVYDPGHFVPVTHGDKLEALPAVIFPAILLPLLSIIVTSLSVFADLDRRNIFGIVALAFVPIFIPPLVFILVERGWTLDGLIHASYALPITIFGGIWLTGCLKPPRPVLDGHR